MLVFGYRVLDLVLQARHWPFVAWPGSIFLIYLSLNTDGPLVYLLMGTCGWILEVVYNWFRRQSARNITDSVPISSLRIGNIPSQAVSLDPKGPAIADSECSVSEQTVIEAGRPLTRNDLNRLRRLTSEGIVNEDRQVAVERTIPFVPFIAAGALLTALVSDNIGIPISQLIVLLASDGTTQF